MADKQLWNHIDPKSVKYTVLDFEKQFPDDATCLEWLRQYLYPEGVHCATCGRVTKHHRVASRPSYSCDVCGHHVHPTAGTIFHKSSTPLRLWFRAIYLMASTRCGVSAKHLERELGVTYKTAWRMFKQIRSMLAEDITVGGEGGRVEIDETYAGGKRKNGRGRPMRGDKTKTPVLGMVERKGRVVAKVITDTTRATMKPIIHEYVLPKSTVFTDELRTYETISEGRRYEHKRVNHSQGIYVIGDTHTNSVEGFWSLIKRGIGGAHHAVSQKFLQSYLDEFSFRYNRRYDNQPMFISFLQQISKAE